MYLGRGGASEGVLAACVLRCAGGQMQGRLALETRDQFAQAQRFGLSIRAGNMSVGDMAAGDVVVCVTGVTPGPLVAGVSLGKDAIETETLVYRSATGTIRRIHAMHRAAGKFDWRSGVVSAAGLELRFGVKLAHRRRRIIRRRRGLRRTGGERQSEKRSEDQMKASHSFSMFFKAARIRASRCKSVAVATELCPSRAGGTTRR